MLNVKIKMVKDSILVPTEMLVPNEKNPKIHGKSKIRKVRRAIEVFGFNNPILIQEDKTIIAGHCRRLAALDLGMKEVPCIVLDHLTKEEALAYLLADNKTQEGSDYDFDMEAANIMRLHEAGIEIESIGYTEAEVTDIFSRIELENRPIDEAPECPSEPKTNLGDLWMLGDHKIICGDCTDSEVLLMLLEGRKADAVFTDPPYNINYGNIKHQKFKAREIKNDNMATSDFRDFCLKWAIALRENCCGCIYVCGPPGPDGRTMFGVLDEILTCSTTIVWNKDVFTLGRGKYQNKYEPIWFGWATDGRKFTSNRKLTNVWDIPRPKKSELHPTMKPVALVETAITHSTFHSDTVLDIFCGSGTTIMACEATGRKALTVELEPGYVDVTIERWETFTGLKAELLKSGNGQ